jgi:hypothetical protein
MNLIQVQDQLKSLPNDPRVMQMLTSYANGMNPAVPPYLALGELNRRKQIMQEQQAAQAGQPPQGTVKDQVEQEAGIMALQQGRQQQAQQQMMAQAGQGQTAAPDNLPQPRPQPQPGQLPAGIGALAPKRMRLGGIVAFKDAGSVSGAQDDENDDESDTPDLGVGSAGVKGVLAGLMAESAARRKMKAPTAESPLETRKRLIKENPEEYGILAEPIGKSHMKDFEALQAAQREELAKQRGEMQKSQPSLIQQLAMAANQTRGQKGLAPILGGYLNVSNDIEQKALQQEQGLRAKELGLQQARMEALSKLEEAKRAHAEGDIAKEEKFKLEIAKIANQHNVSINGLLKGEIGAVGNLAGRLGSAETTAAAKLKAAQAAAAKEKKPTDMGNLTQLHLDALVEGGADSKDPNTKLLAAQNAARDLSKSSGSVRAETDAVDKANTAFQGKLLMDRDLRKLRTADPAAYEAKVEKLREETKTEYGVRPDARAPKASASAAPTTPAPGGKVMTMADVQATAKANNKTEAEVIAAAKAKGFKIQ